MNDVLQSMNLADWGEINEKRQIIMKNINNPYFDKDLQPSPVNEM